jgi:hypothetical protein
MKMANMGERRFYRLPSKSLLGKRVLLLMRNGPMLMSIARMFKYFPYDLDIGIGGYRPEKHRLDRYDLIVVEQKLFDRTLYDAVKEARRRRDVKLVLFGEDRNETVVAEEVATYLAKPVTQGVIFDLVVSVFTQEQEGDTKRSNVKRTMPDSYAEAIAALKRKKGIVLDKEEGKKHAKRIGVGYNTLLERFIEEYEESDLYFRDLIMKEKYAEAMEFLHALKISSKMIGAHDMLLWIEMFETTWKYKKNDLLPTYPGKYHLELEQLIGEIERHLYGRTYRSL